MGGGVAPPPEESVEHASLISLYKAGWRSHARPSTSNFISNFVKFSKITFVFYITSSPNSKFKRFHSFHSVMIIFDNVFNTSWVCSNNCDMSAVIHEREGENKFSLFSWNSPFYCKSSNTSFWFKHRMFYIWIHISS